MYKVLLADDDYPVIEFLRQEIPWDELNLQFIGYAEDGLSALAKAQEEMPDILITDIGMPGMNGIELIQHLKQLNPKMRTVILSCHDEFQYTRQAVKLHVQDYVLKESMEIEEMVDILNKLLVQMDEEQNETRRNQGMLLSFKQNQDTLKEKLISKLLHAPIFDEAEWHREFDKFGIDFSTKKYFSVICYINQYDKQLKRFQSEEVLVYAISNIIDEILHNNQDAVCFRLGSKELLFLFAGTRMTGNQVTDFDKKPLQDIQSAIHKYIKIDVSFIMGEHYSSNIKVLKREINVLMELSLQRFYLPDRVVIRMEQLTVPFAREDIFQYYSEVSDAFGKLLLDEAVELIDETISEWFRFFIEHRFHPEELKSFILRLVMDQYVKVRSSAQYFDFEMSKELLHQAVLSVESVYELEVWLNLFWKSLLESISTMSKRSRRMEIIKAQKYVLTHLDQKITLEEVSELLHLNPAYFSRLYKKETQESFIGYVTRMKMEKAKEWLETTNKTVEEISVQLGYENKSYFNKCFKSIYNMPPSLMQQNLGLK
ncbi:response regulator [Paenibacillus sp. WQ 127069]|uniref:Response regulator n=1 Tax=Paenibacillus baimaensis TaxID=2982185 RepID=A0ABT2ULJ9_9BACL|nr:response regulator [Paenibacillus sp. WQ 127069]MCU6794976.1 response regulator [Paenibacillus sp. WQ 127069]